ncbi:MAG: YidC/Oxa1 family membrane protein insertase [Anaerolineae bacterium]|nr:YidC/Oxa1 family membrane protein insertase [Anaerolineae bacterium]
MWDKLIQGFVLALIWLYEVLGRTEWSLVLSIAVLTIAVRLLTVPFTLPSQRSMRKNAKQMQALKPEIEKLKKKYGKDQQKFQQAQLELYQQHGINPLSSMTGCLWLGIQLPIIWAFYQSISRALAYRPGEMLVLSKYLSAVPRFMSLVPLPSQWLWFNLARPDPIILPILVAASTWLQQRLSTASTPGASTDPQAAQMSQSMMITMPLMFGYLAMQMPAGLSIYFIVSNVIGIGVQWLTNRWIGGDDAELVPVRRPARADAPAQEEPERPSKQSYRKRGYRGKK